MDHGEQKAVGIKEEEQEHGQEHQEKEADFPRRDREDVADQVLVELGKAPAAHGGDEYAQSHRRRGKNTDNGVGGLPCFCPHKGEKQREEDGEQHSAIDGGGETA